MATEQINTMTPTEVLAEYQKARARLKPAVLAFTEANGLQLTAYMKKNNLLPPTADNFGIAIKALYADLQWDVKPALLIATEKRDANAPAAKDNPLLLEAERAAKIKASDAATAKEKLDQASVRQARLLLENYRPTRLAMGSSRVDNLEISEFVPKWESALNKVVADKSNIQTFVLILTEAIATRYAERERLTERGR